MSDDDPAPRPALEPRFDVLSEPQHGLWPALRPATELGFVLYGGTAVALRLGHRTSADFDFFSDGSLNRVALRSRLGFLQHSDVLQDAPETLTVSVPALLSREATNTDFEHDSVKVSFFGGIAFGRVGEPDRTADGVALIASPYDLLSAKLAVLLQRVASKDYQDVAALLGSGLDLARGLGAARAIYGRAFQPSESLKALVYFEGGDLAELSHNDRTTLTRAARSVRYVPEIAIAAPELGFRNAKLRQTTAAATGPDAGDEAGEAAEEGVRPPTAGQ